jgi:hypothetical protein
MDFDFSDVDTKAMAQAGVWMPIRKLDGGVLTAKNGGEVRIKLLGVDSSSYRAATRETVRKRLAKRAATGAQQTALTGDDLDEVERDTMDLLVACTVGWEHVLTPQGEAIPCGPETVRALLESYPVIREQVEAFIGNRTNFTRASSKN